MEGGLAYTGEQWLDVIEMMEKSVNEFYSEFKRCEAMCEGPDDSYQAMDFYIGVAGKPVRRFSDVKKYIFSGTSKKRPLHM